MAVRTSEDGSMLVINEHWLTTPYCRNCERFISRYDAVYFCVQCQRVFCTGKVCRDSFHSIHVPHNLRKDFWSERDDV